MLDHTADTDLASIKLVASDMDFTLLDDAKTLPPRMFDRIRALDGASALFSAASGRPLYTLHEMFAEVADHMAFISDNGAAVEYKGEVVFKSLVEPAMLKKLLDFSYAHTTGIPTICGLEACYLRECDRVYDAVFREFYHRIEYVESLYDVRDRVDANKFTVYFKDSDAVARRDADFVPAFGDALSVTCGGAVWIDIMNKGVDKGTGVARLAEYLGIDLADVAAFGDTDNDVEMLEAVGHSYLVANAEARMEPHARFRCPSANDRGVAVVIDRILAAKGASLGAAVRGSRIECT